MVDLVSIWGNDCLTVAPDLGPLAAVRIPPRRSSSVATPQPSVSWEFPARAALFFVTILCHLRGAQRGGAQTAEGH